MKEGGQGEGEVGRQRGHTFVNRHVLRINKGLAYDVSMCEEDLEMG